MYGKIKHGNAQHRSNVIETLVVMIIGAFLLLVLLPVPSHKYTCAKCGNQIRVQDWSFLGKDLRCVSSRSPTTLSCKHPAFRTGTTAWMQFSDAVDSSSRRVEIAVNSVAENCVPRWMWGR